MTVRATFWACRVPDVAAPFDTVHLRVFYPAGDPDRLSGVAPADPTGTPYPVVVIAPGVNVEPDAYRWLAERLTAAGIVTVTYRWVGELFADQCGITPGLDLSRLTPETYGEAPSATALGPVLAALAEMHQKLTPLQGTLDLDRVAFGGHSAGGTLVLNNADPRWFPGLCGVFSYAGHTGASTMLGWEPGTVLATSGRCPVLLMSGTRDGVIAGSAARYDLESWDPMAKTFDEAIPADATWVCFDGANHFAMGHPEDSTIARGFLDEVPTTPPEQTRDALADVVVGFCRAVLRDAPADFERWLADPPSTIAWVKQK